MKKVTWVLLLCILVLGIGCVKRLHEPDFIATLEKATFIERSWWGVTIYRLEFDNGATIFFNSDKSPVFKKGVQYAVYKKTDDYVWKVDEVE